MQYKGYYTYNNEKQATQFSVVKNSDTQIYGEGSDEGGSYTIDGKITKSGRIDLEKYYVGSNRVTMVGRVVWRNGTVERISGIWEIKDTCSGDFEYLLYK